MGSGETLHRETMVPELRTLWHIVVVVVVVIVVAALAAVVA